MVPAHRKAQLAALPPGLLTIALLPHEVLVTSQSSGPLSYGGRKRSPTLSFDLRFFFIRRGSGSS